MNTQQITVNLKQPSDKKISKQERILIRKSLNSILKGKKNKRKIKRQIFEYLFSKQENRKPIEKEQIEKAKKLVDRYIINPVETRYINDKKQKINPYYNFYQSEEWKQLRRKALQRDNYTCQECNSKESLHVHHLKYRFISNLLEDLITLCKFCHANKHPINREGILNF